MTANPHIPARHRRFWTRLVPLLLSVGVAFAIVAPTRALALPPVPLSGAYVSGGGESGLAAFGTWRGSPATVAQDYLGYTQWSDVANPGWLLNDWQSFKNAGGQLVLSVPMLVTNSAGTFANGAAGAYDSYYQALANQLVADGYGSVVIRLGWEFNGSWFPWSVQPGSSSMGQAAFIADWRHIVTLMRATPGSNFKFDWTVNLGYTNWTVSGAYPGDTYVDYVGVDVYDRGWGPNGAPITDPVARWNQITTGGGGLNAWLAFAQSHNKQITIPEWGINTNAGENGGGDDPYFITQMYNWMLASHPAYETYFDYGASLLNATNAPASANTYQQLWGPAGG